MKPLRKLYINGALNFFKKSFVTLKKKPLCSGIEVRGVFVRLGVLNTYRYPYYQENFLLILKVTVSGVV